MHHTKVNTTEIRIVHEYVDNDKDTANVNHLLITCVKREVGVSPLFFLRCDGYRCVCQERQRAIHPELGKSEPYPVKQKRNLT